MSWCPNCKTEYREGFKICSDCGAALLDEITHEQAQEQSSNESISTVFLIEAGDSVEANILTAVLKNEGIRTMCKINDAGGYLNLYMGNIGTTVSGVEIYVSSEDIERAKELLEAYFSENTITEESEEIPRKYKVVKTVSSTNKDQVPKTSNGIGVDFNKRKRIFRIGLLIVLAVNGLAALIIAIGGIGALFSLW